MSVRGLTGGSGSSSTSPGSTAPEASGLELRNPPLGLPGPDDDRKGLLTRRAGVAPTNVCLKLREPAARPSLCARSRRD